MPLRVLVVQNLEGTGLGQVGAALAEVGAAIDLRRVDAGDALPDDAAGHDALVVLGGAQNALDDAGHPHLPQVAGLMADFAVREKAVLGICLGSQLLARAFGAENLIGAASEFGWCDVALTDAGRDDPVLGAVPDRFPIFQWHDDTFTLPAAAVRLAGNAVAANQAFRIGRAAYGMQFHFEADRALVGHWNSVFADFIARTQPDWFDRFEAEAARHGPAADAAGLALARAWVAII